MADIQKCANKVLAVLDAHKDELATLEDWLDLIIKVKNGCTVRMFQVQDELQALASVDESGKDAL